MEHDRKSFQGTPTAAPSTAELVRVLEQEGAIVLRQALSPTAVAELCAQVRSAFAALDAGRESLSEEDRRFLDRREMPVPNPKDAFRLRLENYRILNSPTVREVLERAAGPFVWHYPPMLRRQTPTISAGFLPFHQDASYTGHYSRFHTCWTPLTSCGEDAPGLEVVCSPMAELLPHRSFGPWESGIPDAEAAGFVDGRKTLAPLLEPGDVVVFAERTIHRTHVKPGMTKDRLSIDFRAVPLSAITPDVRARRKFVDPRTFCHV